MAHSSSKRTVSSMVAAVANDSLNKKLKQEHISLGIDGRKAESSIQSHNLIINFDEHDSDESSCSFSDNDGSSDSSGLFWNDCMDVDEHFSKLQKKFYSVDFPSQSGTKNSEEIVPSQHEHESQGPSTGPSENEMVSDNIPIDLPNVAPQKGPLAGQTPDTAHLQNLKDVSAGSTMGSRQSLFAGHSLGFPVAGGPSANLLGTNNAFPFRPFHTPTFSPNPISFGFGVHYAPPRNLFSPPIYEPDPISFAFGPDSFPQYLFPPPSYSTHPNSFGFGPHNLFPSPRVQKFSVWLPSSWYDDTTEIANTATAPMPDEAIYEMLRKFQNFKQFDTAGDWSDHFFLSTVSMNQPPSAQWTEKIMEEWKILEKNLPDQIFVRVSESRLDIMRAVMIGAEGTPYHNGLFFFDIKFPIEYPNVPPLVYYHSGGQSLNPNLYGCGTVCLSLLGTSAQGSVTEGWIPNVSTVLQVLVSIQGLIFTPEPYYNEPWTQVLPSASHTGARSLLNYNERTFLATLKTMAYIMRNPPKNFMDFIHGHFCTRANDIMMECKAYVDGAQVGCWVRSGVPDDGEGDNSKFSNSNMFRRSLLAYLDVLVKELRRVGARDFEDVFMLQEVENPLGAIQNEAAATVSAAAATIMADEAVAATIMADEAVAATGLVDNVVAFHAEADASFVAAEGAAAGLADPKDASSNEGMNPVSDDMPPSET